MDYINHEEIARLSPDDRLKLDALCKYGIQVLQATQGRTLTLEEISQFKDARPLPLTLQFMGNLALNEYHLGGLIQNWE